MVKFLRCLRTTLAAALIVVQGFSPFVHAHVGEQGQTGFHVHLSPSSSKATLNQGITAGDSQGDEVALTASPPRSQKDSALPFSGANEASPPNNFANQQPAFLQTHPRLPWPNRSRVQGIFDSEGHPPPKQAPPTISI